MRTFMALLVCTLWSAAFGFGMVWSGLPEKHSDPLMALAGAAVIIVWLVGFKWLFIAIAKDDPFTWSVYK